jgi:methyl-accepting chemotaxis protein
MVVLQPLRNASVTAKSLVSALIGAVVLLGIAAWIAMALLDIQRASMAADAAVKLRSEARNVTATLSHGQALMYRAINLKSQGVEVGLIRAAKNDSLQAIALAQHDVAQLKSKQVGVDAALVEQGAATVNAYADLAKQVADFVEADAFNATMFMTGAEQKYIDATRQMDAVLAGAAKIAQARDRASSAVMHSALLFIPAGAVLAALLSLAATLLLSRLIARPIIAMTEAMRRLAGGDLDAEIPALDRRDEVGEMGRAMLVFRRNAQEARSLQATADRDHALRARRQAAMDRHTQEFGASAAGVMANLARSAETMRKTAAEMATAAQQTRVSAARAAEGAATSTSNLASVSAAAEEMSASINEITHQVTRATQAVAQAVSRASATDEKVSSMADAADRVGDVARLITEIAGRTNLLALNATIEAARAGEAGKGFAVVANEVKALATQTAKATDEISVQIGAIRSVTSEAMSAVRAVSASIAEVNEVAIAIAAAVEEQAVTTREIAVSVQTVTAATHESTRAVQEVSVISESTDAASGMVLAGADEVGRDAATMRDEVTQFLKAMDSDDDEERRRYERLPGGGVQAGLRVAGRAELRVVIRDISRGGVSLQCDMRDAAGTEVLIALPGLTQPVPARVARADGRMVAFAFHQDEATLRRVDQVMETVAAATGGKGPPQRLRAAG